MPPPPSVDSAAIDDELTNEIFDGLMDEASRPAVMERAKALYNDAAMPRYLRGKAAFRVAVGYMEDDDVISACQWLGNASGMDPDDSGIQSTRTRLGCN